MDFSLKETQISSFQVHRDDSKVSADFFCVKLLKLKALKHLPICRSSENVTSIAIFVLFVKFRLYVSLKGEKKKLAYHNVKKITRTEILN